jgi:hypothetical protein
MVSQPEPTKETASPHLVSLLDNALGAAQDSATAVRAALDAMGQLDMKAVGLRSAIKDAFLILHARYEAFEAAGRLLKPWSEINANLPRISAGETLFVAGPNDIRRSTLVLQVAQHVARTTKRAVYVSSSSLSPVELALRLIAMNALLDEHDLELGRLSDEDWSRLGAAIAELSRLDIRFLGEIEWSVHTPEAPLWRHGQKPHLLILLDADANDPTFNSSLVLTRAGELARQHACIVLACTSFQELAPISRAALLLGNGKIDVYRAGRSITTDLRWVEDTRLFQGRADGQSEGVCGTAT